MLCPAANRPALQPTFLELICRLQVDDGLALDEGELRVAAVVQDLADEVRALVSGPGQLEAVLLVVQAQAVTFFDRPGRPISETWSLNTGALFLVTKAVVGSRPSCSV
jgi:hypothetical protein